jgi:hypothetical protein
MSVFFFTLRSNIDALLWRNAMGVGLDIKKKNKCRGEKKKKTIKPMRLLDLPFVSLYIRLSVFSG